MPRSLVVAEIVDGALSAVTTEAITAAVSLGGDVVLAVVAPDPATLLAQAGLVGVSEIVTVTASGTDRDHEQAVQVVTALIADVQPDVVLAGFTIRAASYAAAVAQNLDLALVADAVGLSVDEGGAVTATRSIYDGRVHATVAFPTERPVFALLRASVWAAAEPGAVPSSRRLAVDVTPPRVRSIELARPAGDIDLTRSDVIIAIGRGVGSQENIAVFAEIASKLGVALGASRPIVDAGWLPAVHQVGQTGVTVKPRVYIALGISGALHHIAGMQGSQTIVAVNSDKDAPIFGFADVGAVADIHEVAEQLQSLISPALMVERNS